MAVRNLVHGATLVPLDLRIFVLREKTARSAWTNCAVLTSEEAVVMGSRIAGLCDPLDLKSKVDSAGISELSIHLNRWGEEISLRIGVIA